jgi:hypothetical protein
VWIVQRADQFGMIAAGMIGQVVEYRHRPPPKLAQEPGIGFFGERTGSPQEHPDKKFTREFLGRNLEEMLLAEEPWLSPAQAQARPLLPEILLTLKSFQGIRHRPIRRGPAQDRSSKIAASTPHTGLIAYNQLPVTAMLPIKNVQPKHSRFDNCSQ